MKRVAITGLSGVIGQILSEEISPKVEAIDLFNKTKYTNSKKIKRHMHFNLLDKNRISLVLRRVKPDIVIHMAAITHIDACEKDRKNGRNGVVWRTNVEGTYEIAKFCAKYKKHLILLSTECVFDGKQRRFSENSQKNPLSWYGITKSEAEDLALASGAPVTIIRSVVAYHEKDRGKTIYGKILKELRAKKRISSVTDQLLTPTYTHDIVKAINGIVERKLLGIYHVIPKKSLSPYEFALLIAKKDHFPRSHIQKTTLKKYYGEKRASLRLHYACLSGNETNKILNFIPKNPEDIL
jgi:dTDP-4-dehydrorhamnose reductase